MQSQQNKKKFKPLDAALLALSAVLFLAGAYMVVRQYVFMPGSYVPPPATAAPVETTPPPTLEPEVTPSPTPYVQKVPVMLHFVDREISCPIESVGVIENLDKNGDVILDEDGNPTYAMGTIDSEKVSAWLSTGPSPGEYGNAILNGHVRWKKIAGVFSILSDLKEGERLAITYDDGSSLYFAVASVDLFTIDDWPAWVMEPDSGDTRMTLITCHGDWNRKAGTSNERVVVVARPLQQTD
ncbi:MAG: sortase [Christensenellaceae bacterium]|jgi:LPXTG-site transpeptidase (sortase) family protein|nr:sortase [Christensenellaceae bacterium]